MSNKKDAGGLERQKDDFGNTHNVKLESRNTLGGGVISRLQVAELIVAAILNPEVAKNKTVEAVAEATAPKVDLAELIASAPEDPVLP